MRARKIFDFKTNLSKLSNCGKTRLKLKNLENLRFS